MSGRAVLVTGGSRGIGFAIAERVVAEGGRVCITGRDRGSLDVAVASLGGANHAFAMAGDAADADHRTETITAVVERYGRLDVLVNNTGINPAHGPLSRVDLDAAVALLATNLVAPLAWVQESLRLGLVGEGCSVVNVASVAGQRPARGIGWYGVGKAGLLHLTEQLAVELAPRIRVNAVAPAVVRTRFAGPLFEGREDEVAGRYPLGRLGEPADIAAAVVHLASADAAWVTGQVLTVDGGLLLTGGV